MPVDARGYSTEAYGTAVYPGGDPYVVSGASGGSTGQWFYDEGLGTLYEILSSLGLNYAEMQAAREEFGRQFDEELAFRYYQADSTARSSREAANIYAGSDQFAALEATRRAEIEAANVLEIARLNNETDRYIADKEFEIRLKEMLSNERITAAEIWSQPIDYLAYNRWMLGEPAATSESGLPVGAPSWYTGAPTEAVGEGPVATSDIYGQRLAEGGRIAEFGAWGGSTEPIEGTPWVAPHQTNLASFAATPDQARQMAFARWRLRGVTPESAEQIMYAAAPTGTATGVGYG